ncbi:MAG: putative RNA uridine N3 methyltransferase [Candidatus Hermodarchaeia archaeon]|jgi:predicted SPOUT superfamily RNA methylase MTH1
MSSKQVLQTPLALSIAIPSSFIDVSSNKAQKTQQIGRIARAATIFQVDEIVLYRDKQNQRQTKNQQFIARVLEYLETPQYLRKHLFDRIPDLQYVGLLPPLRTPHHPLVKESAALKNGEIREGVTFVKKGKVIVDVGVESPVPLIQSEPTKFSKRITVKVGRNKTGRLTATPCSSPRNMQYWGYSVTNIEPPLGHFLENNTNFPFIIATSRRGSPIEEKVDQIRNQWKTHHRLLLLFGSHREGLSEILRRNKIEVSTVVNDSINLVYKQGTATIRTEEAVLIGLTAFRFLERIKC